MPSTTGTPSALAVPFGDAVTVTPAEPAEPAEPAVRPVPGPGPGEQWVASWGAVDQPAVLRRLQYVAAGGLVVNVIAATATPEPVAAGAFAATFVALLVASRTRRND